MDDNVFESKIDEIKHGNHLWMDLKHQQGITNNDLLLIYPDDELIIYAEKYLELFVNLRKFSNVFAIANRFKLLDVSLYSYIKELSKYEMKCIVSLYSLMYFHDSIVFVSIEKPQGRINMNSMKMNNISIDEIIKYGIYGFSEEEIAGE